MDPIKVTVGGGKDSIRVAVEGQDPHKGRCGGGHRPP